MEAKKENGIYLTLRKWKFWRTPDTLSPGPIREHGPVIVRPLFPPKEEKQNSRIKRKGGRREGGRGKRIRIKQKKRRKKEKH